MSMEKDEQTRIEITTENLKDYLPKGWFVINEKQSAGLLAELQKELPIGHLLYGKSLKVIADRDEATDDILCQDENNLKRFIVIHLTWSGKTEKSITCPYVECDGSFNDFLEYEISMSSSTKTRQAIQAIYLKINQ